MIPWGIEISRGCVLTVTHVRSGGAKEHAELEALMIRGGSMFVRRFFQVDFVGLL